MALMILMNFQVKSHNESLQPIGTNKVKLYLIPGHGGDERLFNNLILPESVELVHIKYIDIEPGMSMSEYAQSLAEQIDTSEPYGLLGVSLGGMLAVEISENYNPHFTIIVSSAKSMHEVPKLYRLWKNFPIYNYLGPKVFQYSAMFLQPLFEPDRKKEEETFKAMLKDKDPAFIKKASKMIVEWDRTSLNSNIIHLHGTKDNTIPFELVNSVIAIEGASHMMILTEGERLSAIITELISENVANR